ncbi:MAG: UDP-glucose/GDP-mannose dehydrogenase family protein [Gemmatimonadales bacterium]|nr:UDP-glucose/GDP-mannose dehydrogenase family protein [Gemmatimonadales bacterium]
MRVAVVGTGYVGLVMGACLAETGNTVGCVDIDAAKVARLQAGGIPIYEPGLEPLVRAGLSSGRLRFTTDMAEAVRGADVVFIAVGTPPDEDGSADLQHVLAAATAIGQALDGECVIVTKSTVPVGTAERVREAVARHARHPIHVCSNPEFLKEGAAVDDFMKPDRVIVGADSDHARTVLGELYAPFVRTGNPVMFMDIKAAEVTKYAANAMLATRISFMNQVAEFCDLVGADVDAVRRGIGSDRRIGPAFLFPGPGYGGSCFPKDVRALVQSGAASGMRFDLLEAVEAVNLRQKGWLLRRVQEAVGPLAGHRIAVWGLAFKAETDDLRESPSLPLIRGLLDGGATVVAHDPQAGRAAEALFAGALQCVDDPYRAAEAAEALVVVTEWRMYRTPDFARLREVMARPVIVDGRNLYEPARLRRLGFTYRPLGRGAA